MVRAGSANWGNTGAPGDEVFMGSARVCRTCHTSTAIQISQTFEMEDPNGNPITNGEYSPGQTYTITITNNVVDGTPIAFGFQILCLNGPEGVNGPEWSNWTPVSSNVQVATASNTNRTYAEHHEPSVSNEFTMTWVAGQAGAGDITFYYVGTGVNGNNQNSGDGGSTNSITLTEGESTGTNGLSLDVKINAFPNPVQEVLNLQTVAAESGKYQLRVLDMLGKIHSNEFVYLTNGDNQMEVNMGHLASGTYTVQLLKDGKFASKQILKKIVKDR